MKKRKLTAVVMTVVLGAGLVAGCSSSGSGSKSGGEVTVESVLKDAVAKTEKATSLTGKTTMDMDFGMEMQGMSTTITMAMDMDMQSTETVTYMKGPLTMNMLGMDQELNMESYTQKNEDGTYTTYTGMDGQWTKATVDTSQAVAVGADTYQSLLEKMDGFTLAEELEQVEGADAYVISGTVDAETMSAVMNAAGDTMNQFGEDTEEMMKEMTVDLKAYFYKDSGYPAKLSLDMTEGMGNIMQKAMAESLGGDADSVEVTVNKAVMDMIFTGYDNVSSLEVPQEVIDGAQ